MMDCDLQHPPATLIEMYRLWEHGYEGIEAVKRSRGKESMLHSFCAGMFNRIMSKAAGIDMAKVSDFKLLDRKIVNAVLKFPEKHTFFRALSSWVGFDTTQVESDVQEREAGVRNTFRQCHPSLRSQLPLRHCRKSIQKLLALNY